MTPPTGWRSRSSGGRFIVLGNWKMNGDASLVRQLPTLAEAAGTACAPHVGIALPHTLIALGAAMAPSLAIGAQDVHHASGGAFTGSVSAAMVRNAGARFTLIGHSERRAGLGEDGPALIAKAVQAARAGLTVVMCCGEADAAGDEGDVARYVRDQLLKSLPPERDAVALTVAYEPCWAIGTGARPSVDRVTSVHTALRDLLRARYGVWGDTIPLLYGGSVTSRDVATLVRSPMIDGVLVGKHSLDVDAMLAIIASAQA